MAYHKQPAVAAKKEDAAIAFCLKQTRCDELQLKTEQCMSAVLNTVVVLPTGYGKTLVYMSPEFSYCFFQCATLGGPSIGTGH